MLSKDQMVVVRKAIERTYIGLCSITEQQKILKENKSTGFEDVIVLENQPCKLSFSSVKSANQTDTNAVVRQTVKVFLAPEIKVKAGSKLSITQNGETFEYKNSGEPALFGSHQEISLELFEGVV